MPLSTVVAVSGTRQERVASEASSRTFLYYQTSSAFVMSGSPLGRKAIWVLPIVIVVCALMVLPAGSILRSGHSGSGSASGTSLSAAAAAAASGISTNPFSPIGVLSKIAPQTHSISSHGPSSSYPASTADPKLYAQALDQIAARPGFNYGGELRGLADEIRSGKVSPSSVYLPNLALLTGPHTPGQSVGVGYTAEPAPMGIGDIGIGNTGAYAYNTTHVAGSVTLNSANGTYPGAYYFITPPGNSNGSYNTPYEVGMQLNTVASNISIPGTGQGAFWIQNVVTLNGNSLQFENNIWNFTAGSLLPGTLYSYSGNPVYPTFYYDYGPVLKLTFPLTLNLYNNISVVNHRDQVTFGYRVVDSAGTFQGIYDTVAFNSPEALKPIPTGPQFAPAYEVNGMTTTPLGPNYDSELVFTGPGGGSNEVINNISGSETLQYSNATSGGWKTVPSAYDFGADTGETAIGVAETWSPGGTVSLSAGPSLLYGLWNSQPSTAVPSGSIEFQGTVTPSYGWVFLFPNGAGFDNVSWVPTNAAGGFLTYLPPTAGGWQYRAIADGYGAPFSLPAFTTSQTGVAATTGGVVTPSFRTAPLYINGNAQAEAAATAITGWASGPLKFQGLTLTSDIGAVSEFFNHLNDWGFVSFNLFQATGVTDVLNVTGMLQGPTNISAPGQTNYFMDGPILGSPPTLLGLPPEITRDLPQYGELVAFYSDSAVQVYNEVSVGFIAGSPLDTNLFPYYNLNPAGGAVILWSSPNANVTHTIAVFGSFGVWVAGSTGFTYWNGIALDGANALSLAGSSNAIVYDVTAFDSVAWLDQEGPSAQVPFAVFDLGSTGGTFNLLAGVAGGVGFADYGGTGAVVTNLVADGPTVNITGSPASLLYYSNAAYLSGAMHTSITGVTSFAGGIGVEAFGAFATTVTNLTADGGFSNDLGVFLFGTDYTNITRFVDITTVQGGELFLAQNTTFVNTTIFNPEFEGVLGILTNYTTFNQLYVVDASAFATTSGIAMEVAVNTLVEYAYVDFSSIGVDVLSALDTTVMNLTLNSTSLVGFSVTSGTATVATNFFIHGGEGIAATTGTISITNAIVDSGSNPGIGLSGISSGSITMLGVSGSSFGAVLHNSGGLTISQVMVTDHSHGVISDPSFGLAISGVTATNFSNGVELIDTWNSTVTGTVASDNSLGVAIIANSHDIQVTQTTATNQSIGVAVAQSGRITISGVTATEATLTSAWTPVYWIFPYAAVVTEQSYQVTISNVVATNYPIGLYDFDSGWNYNGPGSLVVNNLNATGGYYAMVLNSTAYGYFTNIGAYHDFIGVWTNFAEYNDISGSNFVGDTSYGVALSSSQYNWVWDNNFIGDNGATSVYSPLHIQAYSGYSTGYNYFDSPNYPYTGNYWSDWNTWQSDGRLAPYWVGDYSSSGGVWDYSPLAAPAADVTVWFYESGLAPGVSWSVTFNGATQTTSAAWIVFGAPSGTYTYTTGAVPGYSVMPATGTVNTVGFAPGTYATVYLEYTQVYNVTVTESGLTAGTSWSATVGGVSATGTGTAVTVALAPGTYSFQITPVAGYTASPGSGTVTVVNSNYNLVVTFTRVTYAVTVSESGLASGTAWSASISGNTQSSTGTSITFYEPNGSYSVSIGNVNGYSQSATTVSVNVTGAPAGASVSFTPNKTTSLVSTDTFNMWLAIAIAVAVIALVLGLLALFLRRRNEPPTGAQAWTPPPGETTTTTTTTDSGTWNEGPAGGSPPS